MALFDLPAERQDLIIRNTREDLDVQDLVVAYNAISACIEDRRSPMASITIRNIDESTKAALRLRAAAHGRSMEEEARRILAQALISAPPIYGLGTRIRDRFSNVGGVELKLPDRKAARPAPDFSAMGDD